MFFSLRSMNNLLQSWHGRWSIFHVIAIALLVNVASAAKEGDPCSVKTMHGVCLRVSRCNTLDASIGANIITANDIENCGFTVHEEIICCPILSGTISTPSVDQNVPEIPTSTTDRPTAVRSGPRPAIRACQEFQATTPPRRKQFVFSRAGEDLQSTLPAELDKSNDEPLPAPATPPNKFANNPWLSNIRTSTLPPTSTETPVIQQPENTFKAVPAVFAGIFVELHEFPHMAAIGFSGTNDQEDYSFKCGGSLIAPTFVLTAAHCVNSLELEPLVVRLGAENITQLEESAIDIRIKTVHIHPNYTSWQKYDDIAILELEQAAPINDVIQPVCLETETDEEPENPIYWVTGWGVMNKERMTSPRLLKGQLQIVPLAECNATFANEGAFTRQLVNGITERQLCAHDPNLVTDSCQGDSGGPLTLSYNRGDSYRVVGIVSTGFNCATRIPGLYTRVSAYLDYIEQIVWPENG